MKNFLSLIIFLFIISQIKIIKAQEFSDSLSVFPNPFCTEIFIQYNLASDDTVSLYVMNVLGGHEHVFFYNWKQTAAAYTIQYNDDELLPGLYFIRLELGINKSLNKKIIKACEPNLQPDAAVADSINIYPNPVESKLIIETRGMMTEQIEIVDLAGRVVQHLNSETQNLIMVMDVSSLYRGVYFINIKMQDGSLRVHKIFKT